MKSFFERFRDEEKDLCVNRNGDHLYPAHFHGNMEIFIVRRGRHDVWINDEKYCVSDGCVAVIDSFDIHHYERTYEAEQDDGIVIVPYGYLSKFNARRRGLRIADPVIEDEALCTELLRLVDGYLTGAQNGAVREAAAELLLTILFERLHFGQGSERDEGALVRKMLSYVQENFQEDITRGSLAREMGYAEAHISRVFHRYLGKGIAQYINELRLAYVEKQKALGDGRTMTAIIYDAGFKSLRTYYRWKGKQ